MRVNLEESVKKHLPRIARHMGWSHREAFGTLGLVYGLTQQAGIYEDTPARIVTVCALEFDDDTQANRFLDAMILAQLAVLLDDGKVRIRGNKEHIERIQQFREKASRGGKTSAGRRHKKSNDSVSAGLAHAQAPAQAWAQHSLSPLLPFSSSPKDLQTASALTGAKPKAKKPKLPTETHRIRVAWETNYESKHGIAYLNWDGAHAKFAKSLEDKADTVIALMPKYFDLAVKHTFYEGFDSFKAHLNKLHASSASAQTANPAEHMRKQREEFEREMAESERIARQEGMR